MKILLVIVPVDHRYDHEEDFRKDVAKKLTGDCFQPALGHALVNYHQLRYVIRESC